jgi:hypothetical protein
MNINVSRKFEFIHIVPTQVESLLSTLEIKSAPGVSSIPTIILKHCKSIIVPILTGIYYSCIDQAKFPIERKTAKVRPLYKNKGERFDVNSYRGIAILPPLAKIFERILAKQLTAYFDEEKLFHIVSMDSDEIIRAKLQFMN